jgi:hypothetical protein
MQTGKNFTEQIGALVVAPLGRDRFASVTCIELPSDCHRSSGWRAGALSG